MSAPERHGYVRIRGKRLFYRRIGEPVRGTVLMLHGGPGLTHEYLTPLAGLAVAGYEVVLYDQLGCGRSERPGSYRDYTIASAAEDVDLVRRRLNLGRVHLLGHSYGGALALEAVLRHPRAWRSLIVSSGFASMRSLWKGLCLRLSQLSPASRRAALRNDRTGVTTPATLRAAEEFRRRFSEHMENQPFEMWLTLQHANRRIFAAMGFQASHVYETGFVTGTLAGWDVSKKLSTIRIPTLVTAGQYDHVTPDCAREIHRGIRNSRLVISKGQGHMPFFEDRDQYLSVLRDFLSHAA